MLPLEAAYNAAFGTIMLPFEAAYNAAFGSSLKQGFKIPRPRPPDLKKCSTVSLRSDFKIFLICYNLLNLTMRTHQCLVDDKIV
jgi:hypothetical protein